MKMNKHVSRFLHTADWQLDMTRHFFSEGVQEEFAQSRFDAIRELGRVTEEEDCQFMVLRWITGKLDVREEAVW